MTKKESFLWGAFGSVLPEVLRYHKLITDVAPIPNQNWLLYVTFWILFILCAGGFTLAWKPESEFKAIWVGASWPLLVATLVQAAPAVPKPAG